MHTLAIGSAIAVLSAWISAPTGGVFDSGLTGRFAEALEQSSNDCLATDLFVDGGGMIAFINEWGEMIEVELGGMPPVATRQLRAVMPGQFVAAGTLMTPDAIICSAMGEETREVTVEVEVAGSHGTVVVRDDDETREFEVDLDEVDGGRFGEMKIEMGAEEVNLGDLFKGLIQGDVRPEVRADVIVAIEDEDGDRQERRINLLGEDADLGELMMMFVGEGHEDGAWHSPHHGGGHGPRRGHPHAGRGQGDCPGCGSMQPRGSRRGPGQWRSECMGGHPGAGHHGAGHHGMGHHGMGDHGMGHHGAGHHGAGHHGMGHHGMGHHGMDDHGMGDHGMGDHGMGDHGMGDHGMGHPGMNMDEGVMRQHMQFLDEMHHDPHALWEMIGALPEEMRQQHEVIMHALMDGAHPHHDDHEWDERGFQREAEGFAVKIDMAREVAHRLADMEAMAIFGVWQARERLEPAERIEMLGPMVANEQLRMSVRNAAAWVVMDAQAELDRGSASQDTLRELILTNGAM